ncbi:MAG: ATP-binding protein [Bacteroidota bacterium]
MSDADKFDKRIDANPTKEFFISMLIRDLNTGEAISDLVDNCIDGAKRLRGGDKDSRYDGLFIKISISKDKFSIEDNCGGIPVDIARNYAFRFGRPSKMEKTDWSIGQFGIGMKRAFFKIGREFSVLSSTTNDSFSMSQDIEKWKDEKEWAFEFDEVKFPDKPNKEEETGTIIEILKLKEDIRNLFSTVKFLQKLKNNIELENLYNIQKGIDIIFNEQKLKPKQLSLIVSDDFKIGKWESSYFEDQIEVELVVGIGPSDLQNGGWYIFCNDRLIVGPEQTELTGWTGRSGDGVANYHSQFDRFRGFAHFRAKDSEFLPWNTTKTGMDRDSAIFKAVRRKMIEMMKPVMTLSNSMKRENESDYEGEKFLQNKIEKAKTINLSTIPRQELAQYLSVRFEYPKPPKKTKVPDNQGRITYLVSKVKIKKLKKFFSVNSQNEAGKRAFDYVYKTEIIDNPDYE